MLFNTCSTLYVWYFALLRIFSYCSLIKIENLYMHLFFAGLFFVASHLNLFLKQQNFGNRLMMIDYPSNIRIIEYLNSFFPTYITLIFLFLIIFVLIKYSLNYNKNIHFIAILSVSFFLILILYIYG